MQPFLVKDETGRNENGYAYQKRRMLKRPKNGNANVAWFLNEL